MKDLSTNKLRNVRNTGRWLKGSARIPYLLILLWFAMSAVTTRAQVTELQKIVPTTPVERGYFGNAALSGSRAIIGAAGENVNTGAAYIYNKNASGQWTESARFIANNPFIYDYFGGSVAISGQFAIVGAVGDDDNGNYAGTAYIFEEDSLGDWNQAIQLYASDAEAEDRFGESVAIDGNLAVIGSSYESTKGSRAGTVYIFERDQAGNWSETTKLYASDADTGSYFGNSVSLDGDRLIVGSYRANDVGAAYVFERTSSGAWNQVAKLQRSSGININDYIGGSVSISGNYAFVSSISDDEIWTDAGAVYVYERSSTGVWSEVAKLKASDAGLHARFGAPVSVSGRHAVVGSIRNDGLGKVYLFERDSTDTWNEASIITPSDWVGNEGFGNPVTIDNYNIMIAAGGADVNSVIDAGAAYYFKVDGQPETPKELVGHWTFEDGVEQVDLTGNFSDLVLQGGATVSNGQLDVGIDAWAQAISYSGPDITEKTLISWASIDDLDVQGGTILTVDNYVVDEFDGIVFGEKENHRWMVGSGFFNRYEPLDPGYEETATDELVQMAITFAIVDGEAHMTVYRNGEIIGEYTKGEVKDFIGENTEVVFGKRHTYANGRLPSVPWLDAHIEEARIYTGVLTQAEIQDLYELHKVVPELVNPGFELPAYTPGTADLNFPQDSEVPGWSTTAPDHVIEFWTDGASDSYGGQVLSYEGTQHVELNANYASELFQDVNGIKSGDQVGFEFAHRGRVGVDEMRLRITDLGSDGVLGGGDDSLLFQKNYRTGNTNWAFYTSATEPAITALGNTIRYSYEAISTASGDPTVGNFIDATGMGVGFGTAAPEMAVLGGSSDAEIADGDDSPDTADGTLFDDTRMGQASTHTFKITNTGDAALTLDDASLIEISGANASDFVISYLSSTTVSAGETAELQVSFVPTDLGVRTAEISIGNNDADENPYNFSVQGTGLIGFIGENYGSAFMPGARVRVVDGRPVSSDANQAAYSDLTNLTVEAWIFPTRVPQDTPSDSLHSIVTRPYWFANPWAAYELRMVNRGSGPKFEFHISNGEVDNWGEATSTEDVAVGQWYHIAGTYDGQTVRLYVNGVLAAETEYTAGLGAGNTGFYVGGPYPGQRLHGFIDELRLWNVARSDTAIGSSYNHSMTGAEDNLAGYWPFDGYDYSGGYYVFTDKTVNNNALIIQGAGWVNNHPFDEPQTTPYLNNSGLLPVSAVVNQEFRFMLNIEGWPLPTITVSGAPSGLVVTENGEIVWTPNERQAGLHTFTLTGNNGYDVAQTTISIWVDIVPPQNVVSDNGSIQFTSTNKGQFGDYTGTFGEPKFAYKGYESLFAGALLVGSDSILVGALYQDHFAPVSDVIEVPSEGTFDIVTASRYTDSKVGNPLNIVVTQNTLMSSQPELSNVVLIHYEIKNVNSFPLNNVNVGMAMDFDLGADYASDLAGFNDDANLQYVYDSNEEDNPYYYGLTLLSHEVGGAGEWYSGDPESYDDQLKLLNQFKNNIEEPGDIRTLIGSRKLTIPARGSISVVFAAIAADNLEDLIGLSLGLKDAINTPNLYSSIDVPFDQGGKVQLRWLRSREDTKDLNQFYSIWRSISNYDNPGNTIDPNKVTKDFKGGVMIESSPFGTETAWEWLGNQMAFGFDEYAYTAETLYDSSALTEGWHDFMVIYHGKNGETYQSPVISGYSVDNLAPVRPGGLAGRVDGQNNQLILTWNSNAEEDLSKYLVYRSETPEFDFANLVPIVETKDTTYIDDVSEITEAYYAIVAEDIHNNRSDASSAYAYQLTGVDEFGKGIPDEFALYQNFPNPFNPSTVIRYGLKEEGFVSLKVYDILGSEVVELVNESQNAGYYTVNFNANDLAAGIYIYKLTVRGKYQSVNKMILLK